MYNCCILSIMCRTKIVGWLSIIKNRTYNLSTLLVLLVASSVLLTVIVQFITSYQSEKEVLVASTLDANYSKANKISSGVASLFNAMKNSLRTTTGYLASQPALNDDDIQDRLELVRTASNYFNSMLWIDEQGIIRAISPISIGLKGNEASNVAKQALELKESFVSAPYYGATGRLLILVSEPFYDDNGTFRGMIGGTIYLHEANVLYEFLDENEIDPNGSYYYVVGPEGTLLFHPDNERIGDNVNFNPFVQKLSTGESGKGRVTNTQGIEMLAAYRYVEGTGWGVVQQSPSAFIDQQLLVHVRKNILYFLPLFFVVLAISIRFAHVLARPFQNMAGMMNQLSAGELVTVPDGKSHWNQEASVLMTALTMAVDQVQANNKKLVQEASTDALTGLSNRRTLTEITSTWSKEGQLFSIAAVDIDFFKLVNDTYGHQTGDEVLRYLASTLRASVRDSDLCFRYGGEEFVVLMPHTTSPEAYKVAETVRRNIANAISPTGQPITISIGIAEFPTHADSTDAVFGYADKALYKSKEDGRNRTTIFESE